MVFQKRVNKLKPGDPFRDWLVDILGDKIHDKRCEVIVYKLQPASHTVCRYEFVGENCSVIAKFFAEPMGEIKYYDPVHAMENEHDILRKVEQIISIARPIAAKKEFHCVLVTEYIHGRSLDEYMRTEEGLFDRLTDVAQLLRKLHDNTRSNYDKKAEFAHFHSVLDRLDLKRSTGERFDKLLGNWWHSSLADLQNGCRIHNDATPVNYIFRHGRLYAIDFESSRSHASPIHDLGIMAAELKNFFALNKRDGGLAEPYIGHFLWHYSRDEKEFRRITLALPFFMAHGLLRIARLHLRSNHRAYLMKEALACLKAESSRDRR